MDQKKSHNVTPDAGEVKPTGLRPQSERVRKEEREQAIIRPDQGKLKKKPSQKGPLSVGVGFNKSQG